MILKKIKLFFPVLGVLGLLGGGYWALSFYVDPFLEEINTFKKNTLQELHTLQVHCEEQRVLLFDLKKEIEKAKEPKEVLKEGVSWKSELLFALYFNQDLSSFENHPDIPEYIKEDLKNLKNAPKYEDLMKEWEALIKPKIISKDQSFEMQWKSFFLSIFSVKTEKEVKIERISLNLKNKNFDSVEKDLEKVDFSEFKEHFKQFLKAERFQKRSRG